MDASGFWLSLFFSGFFFRYFLVCLSFYFSIATALTLSLFFLVWKILRRRLERFQKHIEHRDLFELLSSIVHVLIWLLLALSCLDMVFRTVHVLEKTKKYANLNYFTNLWIMSFGWAIEYWSWRQSLKCLFTFLFSAGSKNRMNCSDFFLIKSPNLFSKIFSENSRKHVVMGWAWCPKKAFS